MTNNQLKAFIERIERLEGEKSAIADDIKEVYAEAKGTGFDPKIIKKVIAILKRSRDEVDEEQALIDTYMSALDSSAKIGAVACSVRFSFASRAFSISSRVSSGDSGKSPAASTIQQ